MYPIARPSISFLDILHICNIFLYRKNVIQEFENTFARYIGRTYACGFSSARVGMHFLFKGMNIEQQKVALSAYTCIVVPYAIESSGNRPVFVEVGNSTRMLVDGKKLAETSKIIVLTHMFGEMASPIKTEGVFVIEDSCVAFGSRLEGALSGTLGDVSFFSFNQSKQLSCLGGGMMVTNDDDVYNSVRSFAQYNWSWKQEIVFACKAIVYYVYYRKIVYTFFKKSGLIRSKHVDFDLQTCSIPVSPVSNSLFIGQALLGLRQLKKIDAVLFQRKLIAQWYDTYLADVDSVTKPRIAEDVSLSHYWVLLGTQNRDVVRSFLYTHGINTGIANEYSCPTTPYYKEKWNPLDFQVSSEIGKRIINLPFYIGLKEKDVQYICRILKQVI